MPRIPKRPPMEFHSWKDDPIVEVLTCSGCRFFGEGKCHLDPPQLRVESAHRYQAWSRPAVDAEDPACRHRLASADHPGFFDPPHPDLVEITTEPLIGLEWDTQR